jgi:hypothetical protein
MSEAAARDRAEVCNREMKAVKHVFCSLERIVKATVFSTVLKACR